MDTPKTPIKAPEPFSGTIRGLRNDVIAKVNSACLTPAEKAFLVEKISLVDAKAEMVRVDFRAHDFQGGSNGCWTANAL